MDGLHCSTFIGRDKGLTVSLFPSQAFPDPYAGGSAAPRA
jgi:hypothetical protein